MTTRLNHIHPPFFSAAKDAWIVRFSTLDGRRHEKSSNQEKKAKDLYDRLCIQVAHTGASAPFDFASMSLYREVEALVKENCLVLRDVLIETIDRLSNSKTNNTVKQAWAQYEIEDFLIKYSKTTQGTNRSTLNAFAKRYSPVQN